MTQAAILAASGSPGTTTGFKNKLINGNMVIDQRNAGASVTPNATYTLDRWLAYQNQAGKYTVQQNAGSVTPPAGFSNYFGVTSTSSYSIGSTDYNLFQQAIEGFNFADCNWGTANAKTVTLSFWVRSSLTGTFGGVLNNADANRAYPYSYTISAANTWEQKSITIPGDTTGTWVGATNGAGVVVRFGLGVGATYSATAGSWQAGIYFSATGATSVVGTSGATFYITGIQLEVGTTATNFDFRSYGTELALCYRYAMVYNQANDVGSDRLFGYAYNTNTSLNSVQFPVAMRTTPSVTIANPTAFVLYTQIALSNPSAIASDNLSTKNANVAVTGTCTKGWGTFLGFDSASCSMTFSAEL
jgi:hypothetical protein